LASWPASFLKKLAVGTGSMPAARSFAIASLSACRSEARE
jgi:hypothetical protein